MKLVSFRARECERFGALLSGERLLDFRDAAAGTTPDQLSALASAVAFLEAGDQLLRLAEGFVAAAEAGGGPREALFPLAEAELRPPVPGARKVLALAGNYREHIREGGRPTYAKEETYPYFFMKPPSTTLIGHEAPVQHSRVVRKLDYEGELAIVIGKRGRYIEAADAYDHIAGYTILNDISERGLASKEPPKAEREQNRFFDWLLGKWFDSAAPCGPWLVTKDEIPDPHALHLRTRVNGETRQDDTTGEMIFTVPENLAFISRVLTLEPGDLIATGTPSGVGNARGLYLEPGDVVEVEIEGIGVLRNAVVAEE